MVRQKMAWSIFAWSGKLFVPFFNFHFLPLAKCLAVHVLSFSPARDENQKPKIGDQLMTVSIMIYPTLQVRGKFVTCVGYRAENRADNS